MSIILQFQATKSRSLSKLPAADRSKIIADGVVSFSGRFVKQEQWERWRAKRKVVSGSKHLLRGSGGISSVNILRLYMQWSAI